jgi:hypothetical protein
LLANLWETIQERADLVKGFLEGVS